jgi:hypothetical protein
MNLDLENIIEQTIAGIFVALVVGIIAYIQRKKLWKYLTDIGKYIFQYRYIFFLIIVAGLASLILYFYPKPFLILIIPFALILITFLITKKNLYTQNSGNAPSSKQNPANLREVRIRSFSQNLDKVIEPARKDISSIGLRFLNTARKSPPFLDIIPDFQILSVQQEQDLVEFFRALDFVQENSDNFRGGSTYTVKEGDTFESIAQSVYGDTKYNQLIQESNPHTNKLKTGMILGLPQIDLQHPEIPPYLLDSLVSKARGDDNLGYTFRSIKDEYGLLGNEVMPLFQMIYKAARMTMDE